MKDSQLITIFHSQYATLPDRDTFYEALVTIYDKSTLIEKARLMIPSDWVWFSFGDDVTIQVNRPNILNGISKSWPNLCSHHIVEINFLFKGKILATKEEFCV